MTSVVITGIGCVTPMGVGVAPLLEGIRNSETAFGPVTLFDASKYAIDCAAEIVETPKTRAHDGSRPSRLLQTAAEEALEDSGITPAHLPERTALVVGTTLGSDEISHAMWEQANGITANLEPMMYSMAECGGRALIDRWRIQGPWLTVVTACAAGSNAIGLASDLIKNGRAETVIVGGLDTLTELIYGGFVNIGALSDHCRPFAAEEERTGTILGENAAVLVLENAERATARSARIYAEVLGYGLSNDAFHMTAPSAGGDGPVLALRRCLEDSGLRAVDIDYVNAHGTGTSLNDPAELTALRTVFGSAIETIPVSSLKSQIGHGLSSAGAIEAIATVLALYHQLLPPTAHRSESLDGTVDFVQPHSRPGRLTNAISNSFAFGGHAACVAFGSWPSTVIR